MEEKDQQQITVLAEQIAKAEYDLIGLQEVNQLLTSPLAKVDEYFQPAEDQQAIHQDNFLFCLTERLKELGCYYYWNWTYNHVGYDRYHEGIGLLSKIPFAASSHLVSETSDPSDYHTRKVVLGKTVMDQRPITIVSGHFSWWQGNDNSFAYEWQKLEKQLVETSDSLIIVGDFNNDAKKQGEGYDLVVNSPLKLQDAFAVAKKTIGENTVEEAIDGWDGNSEKLRIDYIFTSQNFEIKSYRVVFDGKNEHTISDHFGIEAEMD